MNASPPKAFVVAEKSFSSALRAFSSSPCVHSGALPDCPNADCLHSNPTPKRNMEAITTRGIITTPRRINFFRSAGYAHVGRRIVSVKLTERSGEGKQKAEVRGQGSGVRNQRSEDRAQRAAELLIVFLLSEICPLTPDS